METICTVLDLHNQNSKSADVCDGNSVVACSPTMFGNK